MSLHYRLEEVYDAASRTREQFETRSYNWSEIAELYLQYSGAVELDREHAEAIYPRLNCGLATVALRAMLRAGDMVQGEYEGNNHTFLRIKTRDAGQVIADTTADQFGGPDIYAGRMVPPWRFRPNRQVGLPSWLLLHRLF